MVDRVFVGHGPQRARANQTWEVQRPCQSKSSRTKRERFLSTLASGLLVALAALVLVPFQSGARRYRRRRQRWERLPVAAGRDPGTVCSDGSQYKFFVHDDPGSNDLVLYFEGGGACWDYESCSGALGVLGAANPNGIADDYITQFAARYVSPIVNGADPGIPFRSIDPIATQGWDVVFMPYCTGDVHTGNNVQTYTDPSGQNPPITFRHAGFSNTQAALAYLASQFPNINRLLVSGFSAGGVATAAAYYEARTTLDPNKGFMLNDSGPLFPAPNASFNSRQLHDTITDAWALETVFASLPASFDQNDYGSMTELVAEEFPNDQLAYTGYSSDFNFSRFSYERFFPEPEPGRHSRQVAAGPGEPDRRDERSRELQLLDPVGAPDQRQSLFDDHHLHRQPLLSEHPQEALVRAMAVAVESELEVPGRRRAVRHGQVHRSLDPERRRAALGRALERLQRPGSGHAARRSADRRGHLGQLKTEPREVRSESRRTARGCAPIRALARVVGVSLVLATLSGTTAAEPTSKDAGRESAAPEAGASATPRAAEADSELLPGASAGYVQSRDGHR